MHSITIFGWKRYNFNGYLEKCYLLTNKLASNNFKIFTGGGGGYMEMANKGAYEVDPNKSIAIIPKILADIEEPNNYIGKKIIVPTFAERKKLLILNKKAIIFFPGGMGTIDEFTELLNILKTNELKERPLIYLVGEKYWKNLKNWFIENTYAWPDKFINSITDNIDIISDDICKNIF